MIISHTLVTHHTVKNSKDGKKRLSCNQEIVGTQKL